MSRAKTGDRKSGFLAFFLLGDLVPNSLFSFLFIQRRGDINGPLPSSVRDRSFCVQTEKRIHSRRRLHSLSLDLRDGHCVLHSAFSSSSSSLRNSSDGNAATRGLWLIDSRGAQLTIQRQLVGRSACSSCTAGRHGGCRPLSCPCQRPPHSSYQSLPPSLPRFLHPLFLSSLRVYCCGT